MKRIVIPYTASVNCAFGLVSADIVHAYSVTKTLSVPSPVEEVNAIFDSMMEQARVQLAEEGFDQTGTAYEWSIDLRYGRQVHEVTTPVREETPLNEAGLQMLIDDFEALYARLKQEKVDCIIHCGDIAHTKTQISPEFVEMCSDFLSNLADVAPTYVILGNHDGNLKNSSRQDALSDCSKGF